MSGSSKTTTGLGGWTLGEGHKGAPLPFLASACESTILINNLSFKVLSKKGNTITGHQVASR